MTAQPASPTPPIRVVIIENDNGYRKTLVELLQDEPGLSCVGAFAGAEEALKKIPELKPDVALVDLKLNGMSGLDCLRQLSHQPHQHSKLNLLVLTQLDDVNKVRDAIKAGAHGYIWKKSGFAEIAAAIRKVAAGGASVTPHLERAMFDGMRKAKPDPSDSCAELSRDEIKALELASCGKSNKEIATELKCPEPTIKSRFDSIRLKLKASNRTEAVAIYERWKK